MDHTGCHVDRTGCHQSVLLTIRPPRVVTPGCQIGYVDHTGCHQLVNQPHLVFDAHELEAGLLALILRVGGGTPGGVRLVPCTILPVINWCLRPRARLGLSLPLPGGVTE
jgi:hypothetical protein